MFKYIILAAFVACVAADSLDDVLAEVIESRNEVMPDGFIHTLSIDNSIKQQAIGDETGSIIGSYEYVSPEGEHVKVSYYADETGYHPSSDLLPTPPPVPEAILRGIEYIRNHPSKEVY